jgi:hypothetical protein
VSFYERVAELMTAATEAVGRHSGIFSGFLSEQLLQYSFDFSHLCNDIDRSIAALVLSEFDMRFTFFRHSVHAFTLLNRPVVLIKYAFSFLAETIDRVRDEPAVEEWDFEMWAVKSVADLMTVCQREWE